MQQAKERTSRAPTTESSPNEVKRSTTTTTTVYTTKTLTSTAQRDAISGQNNAPHSAIQTSGGQMATVENLGKLAAMDSRASLQRNSTVVSKRQQSNEKFPPIRLTEEAMSRDEAVEGNRLVTTIGTVSAQSGQSRIVLGLLKDGQVLQIRVQEMKPGIFEVGTNYRNCLVFLEEHQKLMRNLRKRSNAPIESWMAKYKEICQKKEPNMSAERKLVYMCMAENLQGCWKALLNQLDTRARLLGEVCRFYELAEELVHALNRADNHVQVFRQKFLEGSNSARFNEACNELRLLNEKVFERYSLARVAQGRLVELIRIVATGNLGDSRVNLLITDAQNLIEYINKYLDPLEKRKLSLESVVTRRKMENVEQNGLQIQNDTSFNLDQHSNQTTVTRTGIIREISNFNDLNLAENWLEIKVGQLNSSLLSSLGSSVSDSRTILKKHEQIALECRSIEEATLTFNGRNIHAVKALNAKDDKNQGDKSLFEQQKALANRVRDVITILEARIILLRRSIDFYLHSKDATSDIGQMMRRLQVDNSLQSVQFVSNQLELKDVSSVVASGATIISELQQLQLAQQSGQRSSIVSLNLVTNGIRVTIDQLNQDLAHLKTVLNQRKLVLLNEDSTKLAANFSNKCQQLQYWLDNQVKSSLLANSLIGLEPHRARAFTEDHEQQRVSLQNKTLEVEALLRSLPVFTENFDAKSKTADEIQQASDELRQDWIDMTNCLDRRIDLSKKYSTILGTVGNIAKELGLLDRSSTNPTALDRTDEDIRSNIEQTLLQLANQIKNFAQDVQATDTSLVRRCLQNGKPISSDINKQQLVEHANILLNQLNDQKMRLFESLDARRAAPGKEGPPAHERPQQLDPPRFVRVLADCAVEPFSSIELECEIDDPSCQVEWFVNNFKRIPSTIKHSIVSEGNSNKLIISNFSPVCCGTYIARATNSAGQAVSQCKLRLSGIRESQDETQNISSSRTVSVQGNSKRDPRASSPTVSSTSSFSQWRPTDGLLSRQSADEHSNISRIIQGVDSRQAVKISQVASDSETETMTSRDRTPQFPVTQTTYPASHVGGDSSATIGSSFGNHLRVNYIESPASSTLSRSVSKSPLEGTPQPPVFVQELADSMAHCCSRAGLVCLVVGNPPPTIEWLHNNKTIATAKCPKSNTCPRGSICKLTIETVNVRTQGQYICRASNRIGASSTALMLAK